MTTGNPARSKQRTVLGTVTSDKMDKTIVVRVASKTRHPVYGKFVARHEVYKAHDEKEQAKEGDTVEIAFTRRLARSKHWRLVRVVSAARVRAVRGEDDVAGAAPEVSS